ncbi:MAG: flagellar biosynthetic protein FliR [Holophaga sp.]|nr:flagellar biosynthetic protein FliR [Holophaga sp.]
MASPLQNPAFWAFTQVKVLIWMLTLVRMTGLLASMPGFGQTRVPLLIRVALVVLLSLVLAPVVPAPKELPNGIYQLAGIMVTELAAGVIMGLCVAIIIEVMSFAGQLMDTQMGYAFVQFLDPVSAHPVSVSGSLLNQLTMIILLVSGLHHQMILALVESYRILPIGQGLPLKPLALVAQMGLIMARGFQLAFPVMLTLFLIDVMEGISGKFMPQLQLIQLSFPIKIAVGLTVLGVLLREYPAWIRPLLEEAPRTALRLLS